VDDDDEEEEDEEDIEDGGGGDSDYDEDEVAVVVELIKVKKLSKLEYFLNDASTTFKKTLIILTWTMRRKMA